MRGENRLKRSQRLVIAIWHDPTPVATKMQIFLILSAPAYSPLYFPFKHHYFPFESVHLFRTLNRATIGHLHEGGKNKIFPPPVHPQWSYCLVFTSPRFPSNAWTIFCKMATNDDQVCAYLKQEIHDRLHNHSLFASLESFKIWPCELENRTRILSPERAARRHFGEKQWSAN